MGVGEGVTYPSIQNLARRWVPEQKRSRALAFIYSGACLQLCGLGTCSCVGWGHLQLCGAGGACSCVGWGHLQLCGLGVLGACGDSSSCCCSSSRL